MVTVPVSRGNSIQLAPRPVAAIQPVRNPIGEAIGEGLQDFGRAGARFAQEQDRINDEFDQTQARAMLLDYQAQANPLVSDYLTKEGVDALNGVTATRGELNKLRQGLSGKATNDRMRRYFDQAVDRIEIGYVERIGTHSAGQLKQQQITVAKGEQEQFRSSALLNWSDPKAFGENLAGGIAAVEAEARVHGVTGVALDVAKKGYVSSTRLGVINQLLAENRQDDAIGYATVHRGDLTADDMLSVSKVLREPMELRFAIGGADKVMGGASAPNTPAGEGVSYSSKSLFDHGIVPIEGGTGKNGEFLISPKGAVGPAQVMPDTAPEAARLAGLAWDENRYRTDRAYNLALGKAYYEKQLRDFGDPIMAAAAYNAGPGRVRNAVAKAHERGGSWSDHIPAETKDYIAKFGQRMGVSGTADGIDEGDIYSRLDRVAEQEKWTPEQKRSVQEEVDRRVSRARGLQSARENDAYDAGLTAAVRLGEDFTDVSQLGTSFTRMSPQQQIAMTNMAEANRAAKVKAAAPRDGSDTYTALHNMATLDPERFIKTDLRPYKPLLTQGNWSSLSQAQAKMVEQGPRGAEVSSRSAISSTIAFYSKIDGQDLDPKANGEAFTRVFDDMNEYLRDLTNENQRRPTDAELKEAYGRATMQVRQPGALWGTKTLRRYEVEPGTSYSVDIDPAVRAKIVQRYIQRNGGRAPNEDTITQIYVAGKGRPGLW
ncbi:MAG: transglycosylase SLT domain-containing protein [Sphingobium sp.]|uniref:transglycosylase SLT domain-containing protein n=1 Tax=Sphingobium sp. TaxID=1912891 RepID=UPI003BB02F19